MSSIAQRPSNRVWIGLGIALGLVLLAMWAPVGALAALPDGRAYEMVTPLDKNGQDTGSGVPSTDGNAVNWEPLGACCGANSGAVNLMQSQRTGPGVWQTKGLTPKPGTPLVGLFEEQAPLFWTPDLSKTVFTTTASYAAGDQRPQSPSNEPYLDLYLEGPSGAMSWLSQGPSAQPDTGRFVATFDAATPDASKVLFSSAEPLTANATPLASASQPPQYLYVRDVNAGTTELVNVDDGGHVISPDGAIAGNGNFLAQSFLPSNIFGSTTNSISNDGSKVFFTSPPTSAGLTPSPGHEPHLYMRNLNTNTTTPLDNPGSGGSAQYEGASQDGSLVFFTSNEGLVNAPTDNELYVFNTTNHAIGVVPAMSRASVSAGNIQTTLTADAEGQRSTTLSSGALGTVSTSLSKGAGPAANTTLTATANSALVTNLTADATGTTTTTTTKGVGPAVNTTLVADAHTGGSQIQVDDASGLAAGEDITIDGTESATIDSVGAPGVPTTFAQFSGPGSDANQMTSPAGAAIDQSSGDFYVVDAGNFRLEKYNFIGNFVWAAGKDVDQTNPGDLCTDSSGDTCQAGTQDSTAGAFTTPSFVAVDSTGDVYVGDPGDSTITKFDSSGNLVTSWGTGGQLTGGAGGFGSIDGIAVDSADDLLVINGSNSVYKFDSTGAAITNFPTTRGMAANGMGVDPAGNIFKVNGDGSVEKVTNTGADVAQVTNTGTTELTIDPTTGDLYVDFGDHVEEYVFDGSGNVIQSSGPPCTPAPNSPCTATVSFGSGDITAGTGLAVNSSAHLEYVADAGNNDVVVFQPPGSGTPVFLTAPLANDHNSGASVTHAADSSVDVVDATNFANGQNITIGGESATIATVVANTINLTAPLSNPHATGASVTYAGDTTITVTDTTGFAGGQDITIDTGGAAENASVASVPDSTHLDLNAPLTQNHSSGAPVAQGGTSNLEVADSSGFAAGEDITIDAETATVQSIPDGTHITLTGPVLTTHNSGAPVSHTADSSIEVGDTTGISPTQQITIDSGGSAETATVASVPDATHLDLNSALTKVHQPGASVTRFGDTSIAVANSSGFAGGQQITIGPEAATVQSVPDGAHITLTAPLGSDHSSGDSVTYGGDTTIQVAHTTGFFTGGDITIGTGGSSESATIASVPDGTHLDLNSGLANDHSSSAPVVLSSPGKGNVIGETAIANDGSHVYFVAKGELVSDTNSRGDLPILNRANFYVFDTQTGATQFIATLDSIDAFDCSDTCASGAGRVLAAEPDISRPAVPTPNGGVLVFNSNGDLTGNSQQPATTLSSDANPGDETLVVGSTAGFLPNHPITIGTGSTEEIDVVQSVDDATHLTLKSPSPSGLPGLFRGHSAGEAVGQVTFEIYRYVASSDSLTCISCTPAGVTPVGQATLGGAGGGSYGPPGLAVPMSSDGSRIFFNTADPLVSADVNTGTFASGLFGNTAQTTDVYEWQNGTRSLISDGRSTRSAFLGGTTPSGNDVFFTTPVQLVSTDADGNDDIYDARVGGVSPPAGSQAPPPCDGEGCHSTTAPTVFFPVPGSALLTGQGNLNPGNVSFPSFSVGKISAKQRKNLAKTGALNLTVGATSGGKITANAFAKLGKKKKNRKIASASMSFTGNGSWKTTLTLHLSKAARSQLAKNKKLTVNLQVTYSESSTAKAASLKLTAPKPKKKAKKSGAGA